MRSDGSEDADPGSNNMASRGAGEANSSGSDEQNADITGSVGDHLEMAPTGSLVNDHPPVMTCPPSCSRYNSSKRRHDEK